MIPNRLKRISNLMTQTISEVIRCEVKDPRVGLVTVTDVKMSADLRSAKVFISVMGQPEQRKVAIAGLNGAAGFIHRRVKEKLTIKRVPSLKFFLDESIERGVKMCDLIRRVREEDENHAEPDGPAKTIEAERHQH